MRGWTFFRKKLCTGMLARDLRVVDNVLLIKLDRSLLANLGIGGLPLLANWSYAPAIWVWKISQKFAEKFMVNL